MYAGTMQISPFECGEMVGGDFCVNTDGLEHYKRFGYKGKSQLSMHYSAHFIFVLGCLQSCEALEADIASGNWLMIKYRANRTILHDGDYPHYSSRILRIVSNKKRVILGFNFFSDAVGQCCERAPEHSDAFNRTVKLYQVSSVTADCVFTLCR